MTRYVALLRGINVGGKNVIKMADLRACFEAAGFRDVTTFIQSGNVLFAATSAAAGALTRKVEAILAEAFAYEATVVLCSRKQLEVVVGRAPSGFGTKPAMYRYDVVFLRQPLTAAVALPDVPLKEGVDRAWAGTGVLYFSRLVARASESRLTRLISLPIYQSMTIRNWNTTRKLAELLAS